ncbi:unnamed protein product [Fusarium venenatum]|uniref:Uncharacterized protein n=1 Tax=Fusarium venenatum TaxID=56646 RepID=A0A2L2T7X5_9HYPO|nr:uncharacterized protein FVRRES_04713 [Fusarium venenatum]CEI60277.1 unnamed protein product [Fusarium venenatum]
MARRRTSRRLRHSSDKKMLCMCISVVYLPAPQFGQAFF